MIEIIAKITPKSALFEDCKGRLQGILTPTLAEAGCMRFELYANTEQSCLFLVEQFASQEALDTHYGKPYVKEVFRFYDSALVKPAEVNVVTKIKNG